MKFCEVNQDEDYRGNEKESEVIERFEMSPIES